MDDIPTGSLYIALLVLIALSGFFSGSETGLMTLNRYRLRHLANKGHRHALAENEHLKAGLNVAGGLVTCKPVADAHGLTFTPPEEAIGL